jgi:polysaccharide pyruvyl transferase WcaK-like protein
MNILFAGGGFSNKGDEAMMLTLQRELTRRLPGANCIVRTSPKGREEAYTHGLFASTSSGGRLKRVLHFAGACATNRDVRRASRLDRIVAEAIDEVGDVDCVLDFSGFNYSDDWGVVNARRGLAWADYCRRNRKPFVCLPQAWGPFRIPAVADAVRRLCTCASLVYARDKVSLSYLKDLLGAGGERVRMAPDIAFLFSGDSPLAGREFLRSYGVEVGRSPLVAVTPNLRVYERCPGRGTANEYVRLLTLVANHCIRQWGASVILIPHTFSMQEPPREDDRLLCGLVEVAVSNPSRCFVVRRYLSAAMAKSVEGHVDLMIGSRFHSCVFALSSGIPAVALGWTHKYPELMALVGLDQNALIHVDFSPARVTELLDAVWRRRDQARTTIQECLPKIRAEVSQVFDTIAAILNEQSVPIVPGIEAAPGSLT